MCNYTFETVSQMKDWPWLMKNKMAFAPLRLFVSNQVKRLAGFFFLFFS